ncbi:MAG: ComF family protein [Bacilli bacterium]|nr:ComF family protein [Bacilli bacterium]
MVKSLILLKEKAKRWLNLLKKSDTKTHFCKICFEPIEEKSFHNFANEVEVCSKCLASLKPIFKSYKIDGYNALALYNYDESIKSKIFQLKGCSDIELAQIFVKPYSFELNLRYRGYNIVFLPSYEGDDNRRGFNHVKEIFSCLNLKICDCLYKSEHHKQSDQSFKKRKEIEKYIFLKEGVCLKNKKILLVDDICTTGSTLRAAIKLVKQSNPKKIKILVVAKRDFSKDELKQISGYIDVLK